MYTMRIFFGFRTYEVPSLATMVYRKSSLQYNPLLSDKEALNQFLEGLQDNPTEGKNYLEI